MDETIFDTVIVGGGTAGCILAARLSEDPRRSVLLLEAGPDFSGIADCPPQILDETGFPFDFMWNYDAVATEQDDHRVVALRGRALGGSGSVNGMLYTRGDPEDYDSWGSALWTSEALRHVFERIERDLDFAGDGRRAGGQVPLRRVPRGEWPPSQEAFVRAAVELGHELLDDLLTNERDGVGPVPRNCQDGVRMSMAHCYLNPVRDRPNLAVRGDTTVARVLVEGGRAVGVEIAEAGGRSTIAAREVVLAAGAIGSPHLLTLSGIGPREVLERLGIPVVVELPGVGRNLTDHGIVQVIATLAAGADDGDPRLIAALRYTAPGSSLEGDLYLLPLSGDFSAQLGGPTSVPGDGGAETADGSPVHVCVFGVLHRPESVGEIEVLSADPAELPVVRFRYLDSEHDAVRLRHAVRHAVELLQADAFRSMIGEIVSPASEALATDEALTRWIQTNVNTFYHGAGTCRMGSSEDPGSVVDERGRVLGVDGLRVMDFSIAPTVVRAPTNATAMAIAERMAELFIEEAGTSGANATAEGSG